MSINYYNRRIEKCIDKIELYCRNLDALHESLEKHHDELKKAGKITVKILDLLPDKDTRYIQAARRGGIIKSHEVLEVCEAIGNRIRHALNDLTYSHNKYLNKLKRFRGKVSIENLNRTVKINDKDRSVVETMIKMTDIRSLSLNDISTVIKLFLPGDSDLSESTKLVVFKLDGIKKSLIFDMKLKKLKKSQMSKMTTLEDEEQINKYYSSSRVMELILENFFPMGGRTSCRITLDKMRDGLSAQKSLRVEKYRGEYTKIAELLKPETTIEEFSEFVHDNKISDFYCGTIDMDNNLKYLIFDIDVPKFFRLMFSNSIIWELIMNVSRVLIETIAEFGIKGHPYLKFSGGTGIHLILRYEDEILKDNMNWLELENLFYELPGLYDLIKNNRSPVKSKTAFSKLIADSIVVHTVFFKAIEIPDKIRKKLGVVHQKNLFTLSPFSLNKLAVLMDSSPNTGVFRVSMGILPGTGKVSISLASCKTGEIFDGYEDYEIIKEESRIDAVLEHLDQDDLTAQNYSQVRDCAIITKSDLESLLRPDKLLPALAFVLRFGRRHALERSAGSFFYWYRFYQLKYYFQYVEKIVLRNLSDPEKTCKKLEKIGRKCEIFRTPSVIELLRRLLIVKNITLPIFSDRLKGIHDFEFFYRVSPSNPIISQNKRKIKNLIKDKLRRRDFISRVGNIQSIVLGILSRAVDKTENLTEHQREAIITLMAETKRFHLLRKTETKKFNLVNKKVRIIVDGLNLIHLNNMFNDFLKNYYRFTRVQVSRR